MWWFSLASDGECLHGILLTDFGVDRRIILNGILEKQVLSMWN